jgi:uracil-DNA glycosylase
METNQAYYWIDRLKSDPVWSKFRFKRLDKGHYTNSNINIKHEIIDVVNFIVFVRIEDNRIPLFIGPSYKVLLTLKSVYLEYPQRRIIAVLEETYPIENYKGLTIMEYFRGVEKKLAFFRNEEVNENYLNMNTTNVIEETVKLRNKLKAEMDSADNPIDMLLDPVPPFKGSGEIKLIIIGQDPTIKNKDHRYKIKKTLNLDKNGSLKTYISKICNSLGLEIENVYATNVFKYFYNDPPARTPDVLSGHLNLNLELLRNELKIYPDLPIITLGEPVLQLLSNIPDDKVRTYWDYKNGISGHSFKKCTDNELDRPFFPLPHQPSSGRKFYSENIKQYLDFVLKDSINKK